MIEWSDEIRAQTPDYFCQTAYTTRATKPVVIVSDIRRRTDVAYFRRLAAETEGLRLLCVRVQVDDMVRVRRGWTFQQGVDDVASECDLDEFDGWDVVVRNDGVPNGGQSADVQLAEVLRAIAEVVCR